VRVLRRRGDTRDTSILACGIGENNDLGTEAVTAMSREIQRGAFNLERTVTLGQG
jgi:hypothetical protein